MAIELEEQQQPGRPAAARTGESVTARLLRKRVSSTDIHFFTEQLALMLETGANLHQALQVLSDQSLHPDIAGVVDELVEDVVGGLRFSAALAKHPRVFSATYVNLVAASENGGFVHEVLTELVAMEERADRLRATVRSALAYPAFLGAFSLAVVIFVLVVVFPKFSSMFAKIHDQLPATTVLLMAASDFLRAYWLQTCAALVAASLLLARWAGSPGGRRQIDGLLLRTPALRTVMMQIYMTQSLRVMSLSLANGVSLVDTLAATRDVVRNSVIRRFYASVEHQVQQGQGIAAGFNREATIPLLVKRLIATGEESGNLARVMHRLADYYERELTRRLDTLSRMAEPIMLLVMGVVVGTIVSSLILPIFKLSRAVG